MAGNFARCEKTLQDGGRDLYHIATEADTMAQNRKKQSIMIELPAAAVAVIDALEGAGYEAWAVGGCVRDTLLGRPAGDCDIATAAPWQETERILTDAGYCIHRTGTKHGTVTAVLADEAFEITTYRTETGYSDGRHPDSVVPAASIEEDLARRDFTVNALAYHPQRGLLDCFGGCDDLAAGVLRAVGDPQRRFAEDGLRILRGLRFSSQLGFSLEPQTLQSMKAQKMMLQKVSAERIVHEMDGLLLGDCTHDALMQSIDILGAIMPEIVACKGFQQRTPYHIYDVWEHTAWVVQHAPATRVARWSAFFHDTGKPASFFMEGDTGHCYGHGKLSEIIAREVMGRLKMAPRFIGEVTTLVRIHDQQIAPSPKSVRRALMKLDGNVELFRALLGLKRADALSQSDLSAPRLQTATEIEALLEQLLEADEAFTVGQLAIDGNDAQAAGLAPGPAIGALLQAALEAVVDGTVPNERGPLLTFAAQWMEAAEAEGRL